MEPSIRWSCVRTCSGAAPACNVRTRCFRTSLRRALLSMSSLMGRLYAAAVPTGNRLRSQGTGDAAAPSATKCRCREHRNAGGTKGRCGGEGDEGPRTRASATLIPERLQVLRQRRLERDPLPADGVRKGETPGVQSMAAEAEAEAVVIGQLAAGEAVEDGLVVAVDLVAHERQPGVMQVGADLVLPAGARRAGDERDGRAVRRGAAVQHLEPGRGSGAAGED